MEWLFLSSREIVTMRRRGRFVRRVDLGVVVHFLVGGHWYFMVSLISDRKFPPRVRVNGGRVAYSLSLR